MYLFVYVNMCMCVAAYQPSDKHFEFSFAIFVVLSSNPLSPCV